MGKATVGRLNVIISANAQQMVADLAGAQKSISVFAGSFQGMFSGLVGLAGGASLLALGRDALKMSMDMEKVAAGFQTIAKDGKLAAKTLEDLRQFADASPFSTEEVVQSARKLVGTGTALKDLIPNLRVLGEIAAGSGADVGLLAKALSDVGSKGHLAAQETNQFSEQGINLVAELAKMYGVGRDEVLRMREAHLISARDVRQALLNMTTGAGMYAGGMERLAQTAGGKLEEMRSQWARAKVMLGDAMIPAMLKVAGAIRAVVVAFNSMDKSVLDNIVKFSSWVIATGAFITAGMMIVRMSRIIITAYRSMTSAAAISQAMQGPKGWAVLTASLVAAGVSAKLVNDAFDGVTESVSKFADMTKSEMDSFLGAAAQQAEKVDESAKAAADALEKLMEKGRSVTQQLRKPQEIFVDQIKELRELLAVGAITSETYGRGFEKAKEDLLHSVKAAKELRDVGRGVGAAIRGTTAGFSAVQEGQRTLAALQEQKKIEQQQLDVLKKAELALKGIEANTKKPPVDVKVVSM